MSAGFEKVSLSLSLYAVDFENEIANLKASGGKVEVEIQKKTPASTGIWTNALILLKDVRVTRNLWKSKWGKFYKFRHNCFFLEIQARNMKKFRHNSFLQINVKS